jgi:hypothetical protein
MVNGGAAAVRVNPVTVGPDNGTNVASEQHVPDLRFDT